jgi:hypothetical protein
MNCMELYEKKKNERQTYPSRPLPGHTLGVTDKLMGAPCLITITGTAWPWFAW